MTQPLAAGLVAPIFNNMPVWVAEQLGFFASEGLAVTAKVLYGVPDARPPSRTAACSSGSAPRKAC